MSLNPYPEYKDSGVEWLGQVPEHWELRRLGFYFQERREKVSDKDFPALSVTKNGIVPQLETAAKTDDGDNRKKVCAGDFVINSRSDRKGSAGISPFDGSVSLINTVLEPNESIVAEYADYLLRSWNFQEEFYRFGKGIVADLWSTNYSEMKNILLPIPPKSDQVRIATFVRHETSKIDALIAEQENLISRLAEKRQATITHAVTKGLNSTVKMKDSGIEWLGEVPEHWNVSKLKRHTDFITSGSRGWADYYSDEGALFLRIGNLTRTSVGLDLSDIQRVTVPEGSEGERTRIKEDDILYSITAYLGSVAVVPKGVEEAYVSQHVALARLLSADILPKWIAYLTLSDVGKIYLDMQAYGGTKIQLSLDDIGNLILIYPKLDEQRATISWLEERIAHIEMLTSEANRTITLLRERRTALIAAAVTGKIDVRNAVKTEMVAA